MCSAERNKPLCFVESSVTNQSDVTQLLPLRSSCAQQHSVPASLSAPGCEHFKHRNQISLEAIVPPG